MVDVVRLIKAIRSEVFANRRLAIESYLERKRVEAVRLFRFVLLGREVFVVAGSAWRATHAMLSVVHESADEITGARVGELLAECESEVTP